MNDIINEKMREFFRRKFDFTQDGSFFSLTTGASIPIDSDEFIDSNSGEGISISNVQESFSDLVNVLPAYYDDLSKVGADELYSINDVYHQLLSGASPKLGDQEDKKIPDLIKLFSEKKAAAIRRYDEAIRESAKGWDYVKEYLMTEADPESWYNKNSVVWQPNTMDVDLLPDKMSTGISAPVFKLKVDKAVIIQLENKVKENSAARKSFLKPVSGPLKSAKPFSSKEQDDPARKDTNIKASDHRDLGKNQGISWFSTFNKKGFQKMAPVDNRRILTQMNTVAVKKNTTAKSVRISFDFLFVRIDRRRWLDSIFLSDPNWYYPGKPKGSFSLPPDQKGVEPSLFAIPTGMVLIKNLVIRSDTWSSDDKNAVSKSMSFSNFNLQNAKLNGDIIQVSGIQVWGWISRKLPVLPPQDPD